MAMAKSREIVALGLALCMVLGCDEGGLTHPYPGPTGTALPDSPGAMAAGGSATGASVGSDSDTDLAVFPRDRALKIELTLPPGDWESLLGNALAEEYTTATVRIDDVDVDTIGLRFKGSYSLESCFDEAGRLICDKLSMKLKFDEYLPEQRFHGLKRLNLNSPEGDPSLVRERMGYDMFRSMGIVTPRTSYAVVSVNGTAQGLYVVVEDVDGRFTHDRFQEGNGNLYKEAWPQNITSDYFAYHLETNQDTASHQVFQKFAQAMLTTPDAELVSQLGAWTDLDYFARYMAVDYAIANWDGITTFYCGSWGCSNHNYYMYQEETSAHFWIIPWDLNAAFLVDHWLGNIPPWDDLDANCSELIPTQDGELHTRPPACDPTIRALALNRDMHRAKVQELLDNYFVLQNLNAQIDQAARILEPLVAKDPFLTLSEWQGTVSWLKGQLVLLRARLEQVVK